MTRKQAYKVDGLDCAEEVVILTEALKHRPGIVELEFDILNHVRRRTDRLRYHRCRRGRDRHVGRHVGGARPGGGHVLGAARTAGHGGPQRRVHPGRLRAGSMWQALSSHERPLAASVLYVIGAVAGAWFVIPRALASATRLRPDMNLLMTVAVSGALAVGEWLEAAMVAFLFAVSLLLEHWSVGRARRAISALLDLTPPLARVLPADGGDPVETPVEQVRMGSVVVVRPGERIPLDGQVLSGCSRVNQAPITGESYPVAKKKGDEVYAGTINGDGTLEFEVNRHADDTTLARIIHMVQEAQSRRARSEQWVEKFARHYTPAMMLMAVLIAVGPPLATGAGWGDWIYRGLVFLVIGCPCALVISTPVSIVSALTSAARNGVLIKGGMYLEIAGRLQAVAMDKTGTLTYGHPEVQRIVPLNDHTPQELLFRAASVEADSVHPLADAILRRAAQEGIVARRARDFRNIVGKGAEGVVGERLYWVGSPWVARITFAA